MFYATRPDILVHMNSTDLSMTHECPIRVLNETTNHSGAWQGS